MDPDELKKKLGVELCRAFRRLGAQSDLLGIVCSYGDTLEDETVLMMLKDWNDAQDGPY